MVRVAPLLVRMHVKSQMEYRGAFLLDRLAQVITYLSMYGAIWVLLDRFDSLGGWLWPELAFLISFQLLAYACGAAFSFVQFRDMEELVRLGTFDVLMVKPYSPWAYLTFSGLNIGYAGHVVLGIGLMGWSLMAVDINWTPFAVLYLAGALISSAIGVAAMLTMIGASAIVLVQSRYLFSIFSGFWELSRYPLNIFPAGLQWLMFTIVPMGFMAYVPTAFLLGKDVPLLGDWGGWIALAIGPLWAGLAVLHWRFCLKRYQGGGG